MQRGERTVKAAGLLLIILFLFAGCSVDDSPRYFAVAADFPSFDALRAVIGSDDGILMLLPPGTESHGYEPTPKDMIAVSDADIVVYTGGHSQDWMDRLLSASDDPPFQFRLIDQVSLLAEESREGMEGTEHHHGIDEHVWTSIPNEITIIENLRDALISLDGSRTDEFSSNAAAYIAELEALDARIRDIVSSSRLDTMIFASRFPLLYFVSEYGLEYYAAFPGCAEETEPSARTIAFLIDKARELGTRYVLNIELSSALIARTIAEEAGCGILVFSSMHNITLNDYLNGETYLSLMEKNADVLREALS